ncbi:hypothetical protein WT98_24610 [Burkholderia territorii]|nr:hypothetical protein WT98_24610 [Burkholderia territorii]
MLSVARYARQRDELVAGLEITCTPPLHAFIVCNEQGMTGIAADPAASRAQFEHVIITLMTPFQHSSGDHMAVFPGKHLIARPDFTQRLACAVCHCDRRIARHALNQNDPAARREPGLEIVLVGVEHLVANDIRVCLFTSAHRIVQHDAVRPVTSDARQDAAREILAAVGERERVRGVRIRRQ